MDADATPAAARAAPAAPAAPLSDARLDTALRAALALQSPNALALHAKLCRTWTPRSSCWGQLCAQPPAMRCLERSCAESCRPRLNQMRSGTGHGLPGCSSLWES